MNSLQEDKPKKATTWRKSTTVGSITKSIDVEEIVFKDATGKVKPAFLVCYYKSGEDSGGKYQSDSKKICMLDNPLSDEDVEKEDESDKLKKPFSNWFDFDMMEM